LVSGFKNNPKTRRKEVVSAPKYEFVGVFYYIYIYLVYIF
jgi:hypothetical protein